MAQDWVHICMDVQRECLRSNGPRPPHLRILRPLPTPALGTYEVEPTCMVHCALH